MSSKSSLNGASAWLLSDGRAGHDVPCIGLAETLGLDLERRLIAPRALFAVLAPHGPPDPRDPALAPPYPDIAFAAGRRAVPYLRALRARAPATFTVYLKNPRIAPQKAADFVWAPEHDGLAGDKVFSTLAAPHRLSPQRLAAARAAPDARIAALPGRRLALLVGGPSNSHRFTQDDAQALCAIVQAAAAQGASVMATPSRRTPAFVLAALRAVVTPLGARGFLWDGQGDNPYASMIANADWIVVTADSTNMVGEALATSAPVYFYEPAGGHRRVSAYLAALRERASLRRWAGALEDWPRAPFDDTPAIAAALAARYDSWRKNLTQSR
ncbi:MAG: mitochondrial fission ELM1 family protein [Hyphomicrobiales bacterium]|nr:mitochondrial fission ELM1 family protein [Hyphomicrobiales bacterium]